MMKATVSINKEEVVKLFLETVEHGTLSRAQLKRVLSKCLYQLEKESPKDIEQHFMLSKRFYERELTRRTTERRNRLLGIDGNL